jgi:ureidoacrylate peracid hydrolase
MSDLTYDREITALLVIDPYNDFISEGGKVWGRLRGVAEANHCVRNMLESLGAARRAGFRVFYSLHHRYRAGDYETWKYIAPIQKAAWRSKVFEYGTWGAELHPGFEPQTGDIVAHEHWCSSGFANTASYSEEEMHATLEVNLPNYATAIVTTRELLESISSGSDDASGSLAHALH